MKLYIILLAILALAYGKPLCGCSKTMVMEVTNVYENGDTDFHYGYCENLSDGRGFTAGIIGFCTGTGDAWKMIQYYHTLTGGKDKFTPMDKALEKLAKDESQDTGSIKNYCKVFTELGLHDPKFRQAQDHIRKQMYFDPSQKAADQLGLKFTVSRGQLYDTAIEHGAGDGKDDMGSIIKYTNQQFSKDAPGKSGSTLNINGHKVDEFVWLNEFLDQRELDLKHPKDQANQGGNYWAQTTYRIKSYKYIMKNNPKYWGKTVKILDNDGKPMTVKCKIKIAKRSKFVKWFRRRIF